MADKDDDKQDPNFTPVGPGAAEGPSREDDQDEPVAGEEYAYREEESPEQEERAGHAESEEEEAGTPEERLSREQKRRRRKREKHERDQRELNFLRQRNEQLEREQSKRFFELENRQSQSDILAIDGRIAQAENDVREAESLYTQALKAGDAESATEALRVRDELRDGLRNLKGTKTQVTTAAQQRQASSQQQGPDPAVAMRAADWMRSQSWFDPQLRDEDSAVARAVEERLMREGRFNPATDGYWQELDKRLAKRLPEHYRDMRANDDDDRDDDDVEDEREQRSPRRERSPDRDELRERANGKRASGGPTFRTGGRERPLRKGEVYIDADRRAAMETAGVWDDPKTRQKYLESYARYDREHGRRRQ